ncbi:ATP-binding cassette domain-containing protein [Streptococcus suis]|nr:ATP-binding cassette domain-containing protein [Streptococcus suis]NQJ63443.1 ATP-binding cassette domain-containing protein [Streptococcus suis]NQM43541.1 ATP-binding cassette domain-containing protein [Streptococcus suis]
MKIILQNNEEDCLLACYTMMLNDLGHRIPLHEVCNKDSLPADGLSLSYLLTLNDRFGVTINAYRTSFDDLLKIYEETKRRMIIHWNNDHFVVLEKIKTDRVLIVDPAIGRIRYHKSEFMEHYSGTMIMVNKGNEFKPERYNPIFWSYFKKTLQVKPISLFILSLLFIQASVLLFSINLRQMLTDEFKFSANLFLLSFVLVFQLLGYFVKNKALNKYNRDFDKYYSKELFIRLLKKPLLYFRNHLSGGVSEKINLKSILRDNVTLKIIPSFISLISALVIFIYLMTISVKLTVILVVMISVYSIFSILLYYKQSEYNQTYLQYLIDFNSELQTDLDDIDYIKIMRKEDKIFNSWVTVNNKVTTKYSQILRIENLSQLIGTIFNYISLSSIIVISVYYNNYIEVSLSDLLVYQTSISLLISAIEQVKGAIFEILRLEIYAEKQSDLLKDSAPITVPSSESNDYLIQTDNLNFSYGNKPIYKNINLTVKKGEKIAIVGKSGSGKSTLLLLLAGMLRYNGSIRYGIVGFEDYISVVLQNMTLRKGSILENLEWTSNDLSPLYQILKDTAADEVISQLPNKIYSKLLKQGKNLSGGQIQKLLIAKSLIKDNGIVFWDEAFSNLDEHSKNRIYENVLQSSRYSDKTMMIVSHHLDIVNFVDNVIFIDEESGEVIKDSHKNLMETNVNYGKFICSSF